MIEIEPEELREKLIKAISSINSNIRLGNRDYNEMYISNPKKPMGVFAYSLCDKKPINNPIKFLNEEDITEEERKYFKQYVLDELPVKERTKFLRQYAINNDIPFIVFGD